MDGVTLYIDNYRGFRDTYIELKDVNFFVGENSTGKTSILSLLYLLSTEEFWSECNFNLGYVQLGGADDLLTDKSNPYLTIALQYITFDHDLSNEEETVYKLAITYLKLRIDQRVKVQTVALVWDDKLHRADYIGMNSDAEVILKKYIYKKVSYELPTTNNSFRAIVNYLDQEYTDFSLPYTEITGGVDNGPTHIMMMAFGKELANYIYRQETATWIAPLRAEPQPFYRNVALPYDPQGRHTPYQLKQLLGQNENEFTEELDRFGAESGLWKKVAINDYSSNGHSNAPFEVTIQRASEHFKITNVGYGVSQVLPILIAMFDPESIFGDFLIQQPEVHLHPKAQAALGSLFFRLAQRYCYFSIETHSDFLIDRFRLAMFQDEAEKKPTAQVLFFESDGVHNTVTPIPILPNGAYSEDQPENFRSFFVNEIFDLLQIPS